MSTLSYSSAPWNAPPPNYETQYTTMTLTPYLQLPHLLSLTWLAYPILSLLFVAFRLQLSLAAAQDAVTSAKKDLLTSCNAAEQAATSTASMPRLLAIATNEQFVDAVNGTLNGARFVLTTSLTVIEAVVNFVIDLYRSTLLCFLELVVRGGLSILIGAVQELNNVIQSAASSLRTSIQNDIASANNVIKGFVDTVNKVNPFNDIQAPQITVPSLDGLTNLTLPSSFEDSLTKLNTSLPTVADLKDKVESIVDTPFELLKKEINDTFAEISFNSSVMPVPAQNRLSFCNDMDTSIVDDIGRDLIKTAKIGIIILIVLALILTGLNCLLTWYKWRCLKAHLEYTRQAWLTDPTMYHTQTSAGLPQVTLTDHNLLMLQVNSSHPLIARITNRLSQLFHLTPSQHTRVQWFFHYIFHPPAAAIFLIGLFGLLCVELQLLAMGPLIAKYQSRAAATTSDFGNTIATSINNSMYNQSAAYANEVNARIDAAQTTLNDGLFGWVNQTTTSLNATVNEFYTDIENAVNSVFGGTILQDPAQEFLRCFIGSKVDAIENVLTFLHDNLQVNMPRMNDSVLVVSQGTVDEAVQPIAAAAIGGGADDNDGLVGKIINSYADSLRKERIMFCVFLGLWGMVVLMGIGVVLWHSYGRQIVENRRRQRWMNERNRGLDGLTVPSRGAGTGSAESIEGSFSPTSKIPSSADAKIDPEESWDSDPGENQPRHKAEQKKGFMAITKGRITPRKAPPPFIPAEQKRQTAWFDKMVAVLGRKEQQGTSIEERSIGKPELKSTSFDFPDVSREDENESQNTAVDEPRSRWSAATTQAQTPASTSILIKSLVFSPSTTPPSVSFKIPPQSPPRHSQPGRPSISPPQPLQPKQVRNASSADSRHSEEAYGGLTSRPQNQLQQPLIPIPLHYGFDNGTSRYPIPLSRGKYPQTSSPISPDEIPNAQQHRRSISFPAVNRGNMAGVGAGTNIVPSAAGSLERLLTGSYVPHARQLSMSDNPFISPFDDEHRVKIDRPVLTRKSIQTNTFEGVAV